MSNKDRLTLLFLADTNAIHTLRWARWFSRQGHDVHVASFNDIALDGYEGMGVSHLWSYRFGNNIIERALKFPIIMMRLRKLIAALKPDIIHAHSVGGYSWFGALLGQDRLVVTPWGSDVNYHMKQSRFYHYIGKSSLMKARLVTTDAEFLLPEFAELGVKPDNILLHSFGTDTTIFAPPKKRASIKTGKYTILSSRTLHPVHDVGTFIEAIPAVKARFPGTRFLVLADGADRASLEARCAELDITDCTSFTGFLSEAEIADYLQQADIYVSTSRNDAGLASSTAEAMSAGLAVIHTKVSDNQKWVNDGDGGYSFDIGEAKQLTNAICRLLDNPQQIGEMGARNRQKIIDDYNLDTEMQRIEAAYYSLSAPAE
ncbi:MAG: glycosyltransferase family 4 protein [Candidatus Puniceispirillaceae bacterium]